MLLFKWFRSKHYFLNFFLWRESILKPFYLFHDVWGSSKIKTISIKKWFVTFIDDHTQVCWVYLMDKKSKVAERFKDFLSND
jgi:hypothetical protein